MCLVTAMHLRMQADQPHKKRGPRTGMTEDEELLTWKELLDLRDFLHGDCRDGIATFPFGVALEQDAGSRFETREHEYGVSGLSFPIQHDQTHQTNQDPQNIHPRNLVFENEYCHRDENQRCD